MYKLIHLLYLTFLQSFLHLGQGRAHAFALNTRLIQSAMDKFIALPDNNNEKKKVSYRNLKKKIISQKNLYFFQ